MRFSSKKYRLVLLGLLLILGEVFLWPNISLAQGALGGDWSQFLQGWLPNFQGDVEGTTGEELAVAFIQNGVRIVKFVVGALAALFGIIYAMSFVFGGGKEDTVTKQKKNFTGLAIAFLFLMAGDAIASIFNPESSTSSALIDFSAARDQLRNVTGYVKWLFGSILFLLMTVSGIRLITAQGEEEKITKQKKNLVASGLGMLVVMLASGIVNAIYVLNEGEASPAPTETAAKEAGGVIKLLLVFLGPLTILFTIGAGFLYLTSLDNQERATKAKHMIVAGVTGIIIIYIAYALVNTILGAELVPPELLTNP